MQLGLFDYSNRMEKIDQNKDPLVRLNLLIDWEQFRPQLETVRTKDRKSNAGRKPHDVVLMFKILILQSLYNLADDAIEFQILDRLSFMRFLKLGIESKVPDSKTIWLFRDQLRETGLLGKLFDQFDTFLRENGFEAKAGQAIDATIIPVPIQRNSRDENKQIKDGKIPEEWQKEDKKSKNKLAQKDTDARWTQKNGKNHYGFKNHISIDIKHKFIRKQKVTSASVHDSNVFIELLDPLNSNGDVFADSAYSSEEHDLVLAELNYRSRMIKKGCKNKKLTKNEQKGNRTKSKMRCRVEHVFGGQLAKMETAIVRVIGKARVTAVLELRNLTYNFCRYTVLKG